MATIYPHTGVLKYHRRYVVEMDAGVLTPASGEFAGFAKGHEARGLVQTEVARTEGVARTNGRSTVGVCHVFMFAYFTARGSVEVCALESDPWHNLSVTPLAISRGLFVILLFVYAVSFF